MTTRAREGGPKEHRAKLKWRVKLIQLHMHQGSPLFPILCALFNCATSTVIPLLPKATFTPSILTLVYLILALHLLPPPTPFWPYGAHPFFPHAETIAISDPLYSLAPFLFQLHMHIFLPNSYSFVTLQSNFSNPSQEHFYPSMPSLPPFLPRFSVKAIYIALRIHYCAVNTIMCIGLAICTSFILLYPTPLYAEKRVESECR